MRKGFTLIEVLIVLIVIGILVTLMLPQISGMVERARTAEARTTMGALRTALMASAVETGLFPQPSTGNQADGAAAIEVLLGEMIPDAARFNYSLGIFNATTPPSVNIFAERNQDQWGLGTSVHAALKQRIYADGTSTSLVVAYIGEGTAPRIQGSAAQRGLINAAIPDDDPRLNDPH